ncbi:MAG: isochorismatase family protein [Candidatus Woesearchaeota archaeon]|nr:isochorismatase family protein [Candidatus Woesearchaeota archaeon]
MRIFYDVDTQNDFMNKNGALYVPDAELIKPNLAKLTCFAKEKNILIAGSVDRHFGTEEYKCREGELQRWGGPFPDHCMNGSKGELKIYDTALHVYPTRSGGPVTDRDFDAGRYIAHERETSSIKEKLRWANNIMDVNGNLILLYRDPKKENLPVYFEKQNYDVFTNPAADYFFQRLLKARRFDKEAVVYGVATDYCVKAAVLGMQQRGVQCYVVEDAIKGVDPKTTEAAIEEMKKAGAKFINTKKVLEEIIK